MGANLQAPNFGFGRLSIHAVCTTCWEPGALVFIAAAQRSGGKTCAESQARQEQAPEPPRAEQRPPQSRACGGGRRAGGTRTGAAVPTNHRWAVTCHKAAASCSDARVPDTAVLHGKPSPGSVTSSHEALQIPGSNPRRSVSGRCAPGCHSSEVFRRLTPDGKRALLQGNSLTIGTAGCDSGPRRVTARPCRGAG